MNRQNIEKIVIDLLDDYCKENNIAEKITKDTALIGSNRIVNSMGLVNLIVDIETAFLDDDIELSLTTEAAMSSRISPFRTVGSLCNFIFQQLDLK